MAVLKIRQAIDKLSKPAAATAAEYRAKSDTDRQTDQSKIAHSDYKGPPTKAVRPDDTEFIQQIERSERQRIRNLILSAPGRAAIELGIPHLAHYPTVREKPQYSLAALGVAYADKARNKAGKAIARKHKANTKVYWAEFVKTVKVVNARDLTKEIIRTYVDAIQSRDYSAATVKNRMVSVRAILNWGLENTDDTADYRHALDCCKSVFKIPQVKSKPTPISRAHYLKLLEMADERMKACLLLGLNLAMHCGEVASIRRDDFDFATRIYSGNRSKTGVERFGYLWDETIVAVKAFMETNDRNSPYLFVSNRGVALSGEALRQAFVNLRRKAKLPESTTMEGLRDAAYTIACQTDAYYAKFLAGHVVKDESRSYVERKFNSKIEACCMAIRTEFFDRPPKIVSVGTI